MHVAVLKCFMFKGLRIENYLIFVSCRHQYLKNKLARYKIYEIYLNRVIDILPARKCYFLLDVVMTILYYNHYCYVIIENIRMGLFYIKCFEEILKDLPA